MEEFAYSLSNSIDIAVCVCVCVCVCERERERNGGGGCERDSRKTVRLTCKQKSFSLSTASVG